LFAKYPAGGQGERCRHKGNGKPADMAVVGKTEAKTGSEPKTTVSWTPVLKLKNTNEKAAIPFFADRSILRSLLSRQKITAPRRRPTVWMRMSKHFFNSTRRFHFLSEFFR